METDTQAQVAFFLTGKRSGEHLDAVDGLGLRPALFAGYRELSRLRHDFPLVLVAGATDQHCLQSLSGLIDSALAVAASGSDGERIRKQVLRLEQEIRTLTATGVNGTLSTLWDQAADRLATPMGGETLLRDSLQRARAAIKVDGEVAGCDVTLPRRFLHHALDTAQRQKSRIFRKSLDRLVRKLSDILKADFACSEAGRSAPQLAAAMGAGFNDFFDFDAMSNLLITARPHESIPENRRRRIRDLLAVLESQQFFPRDEMAVNRGAAAAPYHFTFERCLDALAAFRARTPKLIELARAIAAAELEIDGLYNETRHDALFEHFGANGLDPEDLALFPDYLVSLNAGKMEVAEHARLMEILSSGLPIKILLQIDDIIETASTHDGDVAFGMRARQIANMAIGLNDVFVLQSSSSNLFRFRERVMSGLGYRGPALFSVFSGESGRVSGISPYLASAAAMESRTFPAFTYDPSAGTDWASRFYLGANAQIDLDWPIQGFTYADGQHQTATQELAFTPVDFIASDRRFARHFARVPREKWNGSLIDVDEALTRERKGLPDKVPSLLMIDAANVLQKVIVDERLIREARRCRQMWHSLQELGGVNNSHAENQLARERKIWAERLLKDADSRARDAADTGAPAAASPLAADAPPAPEQVAVQEHSPDEAYIDTARCSSCDECTQINNRMFAYDENKQAYIADINAGTYAQLVEAAESCQVAVIHPGKPRNVNEPGIDELVERAAPFL